MTPTTVGDAVKPTDIRVKDVSFSFEEHRYRTPIKFGGVALDRATLVVASPFDAALHDAFGKVHALNCYHTYGPDFLSHDLGHYLGKEFAGEQLDRYVARHPQPRMPLYHLVGALDPLEASDVR